MKRVLKVVVLWIVILGLHPVAGIVNRKTNNSSKFRPQFYPRRENYKRKSYLEPSRPLWVLEDKVTRPGEINVPTRKPTLKNKSKRRFITPAITSLKLPSHYTNLSPDSVITSVPNLMPRNRKHQSQNQRIFPIFDDYGTESEPILIYRGPKAKMIFNTMMSKKKYPMKEPVPGQVMYPPYSPKFKPTPVVESVRSENYAGSVFHNLTLIPFYAHEAAMDPRYSSIDPIDSSYEIKTTSPELQKQPTNKEDCHNCYHSYYSQNDVQTKYWSLPFITPAPESTTPMSLERQIAVPNGIYSNHRMEETTPLPDTSFQINYESETQSPPKKRYRSVLSGMYGGLKTVYPIYTLNKLLRYKPFKTQKKDVTERKGKKPTAPEETWLIWNSRNRKAHKSNYLNSISSKELPKNFKTSRMIDDKLLIK